MSAPGIPVDEAERLKALHEVRVLDTAAEEVFDEITDLAATICETPMALISFVDQNRVWLKSKVGIASEEVPRDLSFCGHGILEKDVFVVPDTHKDRRFAGNPFVQGDPHVRFYAGTPLRTHDGHVLGMMCVLDRHPRQLRPSHQKALRMLARLVITELEARRSSELLQRLEVEAANLRLVRTMANRLLHEIGNAILPLSTHQQLLAERYNDPEFRISLSAALSEGVRRVSRLISQMRHLAQEVEHAFEPVPLHRVVEEAYKAAVKDHGPQSGRLRFDAESKPIFVEGDMASLTHAFAEIILNALQANPQDPEINIRCAITQTNGSPAEVVVDVCDNGKGFEPETAAKATTPFFTTRHVGPGLGLSVARRVIEKHHGQIEIIARSASEAGGVRIHLPLASQTVHAAEPAEPAEAKAFIA